MAAGTNVTLANVILDNDGGPGSVSKVGAATLTLTGTNTYTGGTTFSAGVLNVGSAGAIGTTGTLSFIGGTLQYSAANTTDYSGRFSTAANQLYSIDTNGQAVNFATALASNGGSLTKLGAGTLSLGAVETYTGATTVAAGTLSLMGSLAATTTTVASGATFAGTGTSAGSVTIQTGGMLAPGLPGAGNVGTLTVGSLVQNAGANFNVDLGAPNVVGGTTNDLITDTGAATIAGTVNVNQLAGFGAGAYRLINYAGALTNNGVGVAGAPAGSVVQAGNGQVNLLVGGANGIGQYWNGATTTPNGVVNGGTGSWTNAATNTNWTDANGAFSESWASGTGIFAGAAGTVTVNDAIAFQALEFATTGYNVVAGTGTLTAIGASSITTDPNVTTTIAAPIAGSVGLTKAGTGTLIFTGANGYTGGTTISAGTLQLGAGGATGSIVGSVADNATLAFDHSDAETFAGTVSGNGTVAQIGAGNTTLSGTNTYAGGTTLTTGTITVANNAALGTGTLAMAAGTTLAFAPGGNYTIANPITISGDPAFNTPGGQIDTLGGVIADGAAPGTLEKTGTGTLVLTATNTYTGATTVDAGTLLVNGSIATSSGVTVAPGATLGGSGTVASIAVGGGTLAPGGTPGNIGTLSVAGNVIFTGASTYAVTVSPVAASLTNATGGATLAGTVAATFQNGGYVGKTYTILTAATGVAGTFNTLATANLPTGFTASLSYDANDAFLNLAAINLTTAIGTGGLTPNQTNVSNALNGYFNRGGALPPAFVTIFGQTGTTLAASLSQLSGEGITAAQSVAHRSGELFTSTITDQTTFYGGAGGAANSITLSDAAPGAPLRELADLPANQAIPVAPAPRTRTWRAWATGFGGTEDIQGSASLGSNSVNSTLYGGSLGVDYQLTPDYLAGIAVGGSDGEFSLPSLATSGSTTGGHVAFYDIATFGAFYGASSTGFSYYTNKTTRTAITGTERGNFDSHEFRSRVEFGRHFGYAGAVVTPFVALEIADFRSNGFNETTLSGTNVFGLNVQGQSTPSVPSFVGARYQQAFVVGNGMIFAPSLQLAYVHEFAPERSQIAGFEALPGATFLVDGARPDRNAAQIKAGAELSIGPASALFASFDSEISGHAQFYAGKGGLKIGW